MNLSVVVYMNSLKWSNIHKQGVDRQTSATSWIALILPNLVSSWTWSDDVLLIILSLIIIVLLK